jgi:hypothetical protein
VLGGLRKWLLLLVLVGVGLVVAAGPLRANVSDLRAKAERFVKEKTGGESNEQMSQSEFRELAIGDTRAHVRELVGSPQSTQRTTIEGVHLECWYYGIAAGTGSYQLCFADGRLRSKVRFAAL